MTKTTNICVTDHGGDHLNPFDGKITFEPKTHDKYFDLNGKQISLSEIAKDWSNVGSVIRTQEMTVKQYEEMLRRD